MKKLLTMFYYTIFVIVLCPIIIPILFFTFLIETWDEINRDDDDEFVTITFSKKEIEKLIQEQQEQNQNNKEK